MAVGDSDRGTQRLLQGMIDGQGRDGYTRAPTTISHPLIGDATEPQQEHGPTRFNETCMRQRMESPRLACCAVFPGTIALSI